MTERSGQPAQWTINGVVLPCLVGQACSDDSTMCCGVARTVQSANEPAQIPVEVTVVQELVSKPDEKENVPAKSLPEEQAAPAVASVTVAPEAVPIVPPSENAVVPSADKGKISELFHLFIVNDFVHNFVC